MEDKKKDEGDPAVSVLLSSLKFSFILALQHAVGFYLSTAKQMLKSAFLFFVRSL